MEKKINLKSSEILNKKFKTEISGYSASEVDTFFDLMLEDYRTYESEIILMSQELEDNKVALEEREEKIEVLKMEIENQNTLLGKIEKSSSGSMAIEIEQLRAEISQMKNKK